MPPSPGRGLPLYQHWHGCLPETPLYLLPIPGPGGVIFVLSGTSSSEPPRLQHEDPGDQGCPEETDWTFFSSLRLLFLYKLLPLYDNLSMSFILYIVIFYFFLL